jgi:hypothetical protein
MKRTIMRAVALTLLLAMGFAAVSASAFTSRQAVMAETTADSAVQIGQYLLPADMLLGDVNNDGIVNASDAIIVLRYTLNVMGLTTSQLAAADCNGDGAVDTADALIIMRYCIGTPMPEPEPTPQITGPTIIVDNATASAGETVTVNVRVENNPGVSGAKLTLSYDSRLTLTNAVSGTAFSSLDYTNPPAYTSPCYFNWDSLTGMATDDGIILTLTFIVSASVSQGDSMNVMLSYNYGDIYDEDINDLDFELINGTITIN